jgi:predicted nucleotidyltransferase
MIESTLTSNSMETPRPDIVTGEFVALLKRAGVTEAFLFGSVSRGEERPDSDIDLFIRFGHDYSLKEHMGLMVKLSRLTGRQVQVVTDIDPIFEPYITPTLVPIPLQ